MGVYVLWMAASLISHSISMPESGYIPVEVPLPLSGSGSKMGSKIPNSLTLPSESLVRKKSNTCNY